MNEGRRDELIDAYYGGLDAEEYGAFDEIFADDAEYARPGQRTLRGGDEIRAFFETERRSSNTTHQVTKRLHDDDATYCKVAVRGDLPDGSFEGDVVAEFEFDDAASQITAYRVYRGYQR